VRQALLDAQSTINFSYGIGINELDLDLGGSGPMIVPGNRFVIGGGKQGVMHVWRLDSLGGFSASDASVVQKFVVGDPESQDNDFAGEDSAIMQWHDVRSGHIMGGPVYWPRPANAGGSLMFNWSEDSELRSYTVDPQATSPIDPRPFARGVAWLQGHPGGILALSANRATPRSGIVWAATYDAQHDETGALRHVRPGFLRAYDAETLVEVWRSDDERNDDVGNFAKFVPPTVANGRVYLATFSDDVKVYGLRNHRYARPAAQAFIQAVLPLLDDPLLDD
jgi:outer membrane protein assembly factor BamB